MLLVHRLDHLLHVLIHVQSVARLFVSTKTTVAALFRLLIGAVIRCKTAATDAADFLGRICLCPSEKVEIDVRRSRTEERLPMFWLQRRGWDQ